MPPIDMTGMPKLSHVNWWNEAARHYGALDAFHHATTVRMMLYFARRHIASIEAAGYAITEPDIALEFFGHFRRELEASRMIERHLVEWLDLIDAAALGGG